MSRAFMLSALAAWLCACLVLGPSASAQQRTDESATPPRAKHTIPASQPSRAPAVAPAPRGQAFDLLGTGPQEWKCTETEYGKSCECKGMIDCAKLINSGKCKGGSIWEAPEDPSVGGCDMGPDN